MRKCLYFVALFFCTLQGFADPVVQSVKAVTTAAPINGMVTQEKPVYTLRLNSNPTTGFSWFIVSYPFAFVRIVGHQYIAPNVKMAGAGGTEVWQFQATPLAFVAPTAIKIKMMYARPWSISDSDTVQTFYMITT